MWGLGERERRRIERAGKQKEGDRERATGRQRERERVRERKRDTDRDNREKERRYRHHFECYKNKSKVHSLAPCHPWHLATCGDHHLKELGTSWALFWNHMNQIFMMSKYYKCWWKKIKKAKKIIYSCSNTMKSTWFSVWQIKGIVKLGWFKNPLFLHCLPLIILIIQTNE